MNLDHLADLKQQVKRLPKSPGIYQWKDAEGNIIYVGKATDLRSRTSSYVNDPSVKGGKLMAAARSVEYIAVGNQKEALVLEQTLIKRHRPRFNVRLTDDKQYPYIWLTPGPYPRLVKTHGQKSRAGTWFGPLPDGYGAFHVIQALNELLPLRRCRVLPKEKCLYLDIGKCIGPCIDACTDEEYDAVVQEARDLLTGKATHVIARLEEKVHHAAERHDFEEAARLRDQLRGLRGVVERQHMVKADLADRDICAASVRGDRGVVVIMHQRDGKVVGQSPFVIRGAGTSQSPLEDFLVGYYAERPIPRYVTIPPQPESTTRDEVLEQDLRNLHGSAVTVERPQRGDKKRWIEVALKNAELRLVQEEETTRKRGEGALALLQNHLQLPELPRVIEGFDISHMAGKHMRAAMVRFVDGEPDKGGYRTFGMKTVGDAAPSKGKGREIDDFAAIKEAVDRRLRRLVEEGRQLPDLLVIDGGKGQLNAALQAVKGHGLEVPICSLAKQDEEIFLPGRINPVRLPKNDAALQLLQRVRDESHRFGITQVRRRTTSAVTDSPLEAIKGIGPKKRQQLIQAFGGLEGLRAASIEDLCALPGINLQTAQSIVAVLQDVADTRAPQYEPGEMEAQKPPRRRPNIG